MRRGAENPASASASRRTISPDSGTEQTVSECLTTEWLAFRYALEQVSADTMQLYVVFAVVFDWSVSGAIELRSIRYSPN